MVYAGKCGVMASDKFCGTRAPPNFTSEGDICIEFISDHIVTRPGFQVLIKTDKGKILLIRHELHILIKTVTIPEFTAGF